MSEETTDKSGSTIDKETVSAIEAEIAKMDEAEREKLISKFTKEKVDMEAKYKQEVAELNKKYGKVSEEKADLEKKYADYAQELSKKIEDMSSKFEKTWEQYQPPRTGLANTGANPFKDKSPKDIVKSLEDPRKWSQNDDVRARVEDEFFSMMNMQR